MLQENEFPWIAIIAEYNGIPSFGTCGSTLVGVLNRSIIPSIRLRKTGF
jgi:hypothetical protein